MGPVPFNCCGLIAVENCSRQSFSTSFAAFFSSCSIAIRFTNDRLKKHIFKDHRTILPWIAKQKRDLYFTAIHFWFIPLSLYWLKRAEIEKKYLQLFIRNKLTFVLSCPNGLLHPPENAAFLEHVDSIFFIGLVLFCYLLFFFWAQFQHFSMTLCYMRLEWFEQ